MNQGWKRRCCILWAGPDFRTHTAFKNVISQAIISANPHVHVVLINNAPKTVVDDSDCVYIYLYINIYIYTYTLFIADSVRNIRIITYKSDDTTDTITGHRWSPMVT